MSRVERDKKNALQIRGHALSALRVEHGPQTNAQFARMTRKSLEAIAETSFQAMAEVEVELANGKIENQLWYANEGVTINSPLKGINVLAWTHPGLQAALTEDLDESVEPAGRGYTIVELSPKARARFKQVVPEIVGLYEPGGAIGHLKEADPTRAIGLKAVRLDMTRDQSRAFRHAMSSSAMCATSAPSSVRRTCAATTPTRSCASTTTSATSSRCCA